MEEPPGTADGPLLHLVAGAMGKNPFLVYRLIVEG